jgi:small subunit ribosomal protein S6
MIRYESLFLAVPEITADETKTVESQLEKVVQDLQGTIISYERWGKYRLAYPVRKNEYGVYFLMRFEIGDKNKVKLLESLNTVFAVKQADLIMRSIVVVLAADRSLEYHRPESLEEVPTRDVDTFLKENKMSGLLSKSPAASKAVEEVDLDEDLMMIDEQ